MGEDIPALRVRPQAGERRAGLCDPVPARGRDPDAVHPASSRCSISSSLRCCSARSSPSSASSGLRITRPDLPRPYRAWGYPVTPALFVLVTLFMMYHLAVERPLQSLLGALTMVSGLLIHAVFRKRDDAGRMTPLTAHTSGQE